LGGKELIWGVIGERRIDLVIIGKRGKERGKRGLVEERKDLG
jgi:hypothetical protein